MLGFVGETGDQLLKGRLQRLLEGGPTVLLHGLLSDKKRHQFPLAHGDQWKLPDRLVSRRIRDVAGRTRSAAPAGLS